MAKLKDGLDNKQEKEIRIYNLECERGIVHTDKYDSYINRLERRKYELANRVKETVINKTSFFKKEDVISILESYKIDSIGLGELFQRFGVTFVEKEGPNQ